MNRNISKIVTNCVKTFEALILKESAWNEGEIHIFEVQNELHRFKVWAGNIRAHQAGRSSLDYRLRDASHLKTQVLRLLQSLSRMFEDAASIVRGERLPWDKLPNEDASDDDEFYLSTTPNTELGQILRNITDINTCLLGLSISIRNPAPHDRFRALNSSDAGHYEPYDIEHVQAKFPNIDREISERLGKAISRRRQYFKYREAHRDALSYGIDSDDSNKTWTIPRSTIASSIPEALKGDEAFDLTLIDDDVVSETGLSQTSYASSTNAPDQLRVPPLPAGAKNGPFECPFCYTIIIARSKSAWQ